MKSEDFSSSPAPEPQAAPDARKARPGRKRKAATPPEVDADAVLFGESDHRSGKDEMNLAGNPFAAVRYGADPKEIIYYEWERHLDGGRKVTASWRVTGDTILGLPGPSDECLYLVLLDLTRQADWMQTIHFSRHALLERLGWPSNTQTYQLLGKCFSRLKAVSITATHAFWNPRTHAPMVQVGFSILDNYEINVEPPGRKKGDAKATSFFKWNDVVFASFEAGNVRDLPLDFALSLRNPTARRLFRYLDMMRLAGGTYVSGGRSTYQVGLLKLRDHLGVLNLHHPSKIKERLASAHAELVERGFLRRVEFKPMASGGEMAVYSFGLACEVDAKRKSQRALRAPEAASDGPAPAPPIPWLVPERSVREEVALSFQKADLEVRAEASDAVLDVLGPAEQERIRALCLATLAPFLREQIHTPVTQRVLRDQMRERVRQEHPAAFELQMERRAKRLIEEPRESLRPR